jgi:hypothetical protein
MSYTTLQAIVIYHQLLPLVSEIATIVCTAMGLRAALPRHER